MYTTNAHLCTFKQCWTLLPQVERCVQGMSKEELHKVHGSPTFQMLAGETHALRHQLAAEHGDAPCFHDVQLPACGRGGMGVQCNNLWPFCCECAVHRAL